MPSKAGRYRSCTRVVARPKPPKTRTVIFGELVYAGMDWVDPQLTKRSMELMATEVMPRVNAAIGKADEAKAAA